MKKYQKPRLQPNQKILIDVNHLSKKEKEDLQETFYQNLIAQCLPKDSAFDAYDQIVENEVLVDLFGEELFESQYQRIEENNGKIQNLNGIQ